ncbi:MAG: hypothetical protein CMM50_14915 [Rhodospirillaceae bacterium]|nr:hypothetical protein [Rhodospirillaceae bacterium]
MDISPLIPGDRQVIESYGGGGFKISGERFDGSVVIFPERVVAWSVAAAGDVTPEMMAIMAGAEAPAVDLLLFGSGKGFARLPEPAVRAVRGAGIIVETMDTGAACRTYNVLMAEGRRVAAALIAVP